MESDAIKLATTIDALGEVRDYLCLLSLFLEGCAYVADEEEITDGTGLRLAGSVAQEKATLLASSINTLHAMIQQAHATQAQEDAE